MSQSKYKSQQEKIYHGGAGLCSSEEAQSRLLFVKEIDRQHFLYSWLEGVAGNQPIVLQHKNICSVFPLAHAE